MDPHRIERVSESIREELEELISYELSDPRIGGVNVTEVQVSPDFRHAMVRLVLDGTAEEQNATLAGIDHAKPFLKKQLSTRLQLHRTPELHFDAAISATLGAKTPQVLRRIRRGRPRDQG